MKRESRAPLIIAIVLLLLPVLYVGSYLAMVVPEGTFLKEMLPDGTGVLRGSHYRAFPDVCEKIFAPLQWMDLNLRPGAWKIPGEGAGF
jgi:hypothetical protein